MEKPAGNQDVIKTMAEALSTHDEGDTTSDLSSTLDALALFVHAEMLKHGFRVVGFNEDQTIEAECKRLAPRLPPHWNDSVNSRSFVYAHDQSSMRFIIKLDRLGSKMEIRGLAVGDERIYRTEIQPRDYVNASALPLRISKTDDGKEDRSDLEQKLQSLFPDDRVRQLSEKFETDILKNLFPSEGIKVQGDRPTARPDNIRPQDPSPLPEPAAPRPYPHDDPLTNIPRRPVPPDGDFPPPDFDDEYDINRAPPGWPRGGTGGPFNPVPFNIGGDDLNPPGLGPHDPLRPSFVPGYGGGLPRPGGGGGMHPTFDDPLFRGGGGDDGPGIGDGGGGFPSNAPPGARWDPIGPGGSPHLPGGPPNLPGGSRPGGGGNDPFRGRFGPGGWGGGGIV